MAGYRRNHRNSPSPPRVAYFSAQIRIEKSSFLICIDEEDNMIRHWMSDEIRNE